MCLIKNTILSSFTSMKSKYFYCSKLNCSLYCGGFWTTAPLYRDTYAPATFSAENDTIQTSNKHVVHVNAALFSMWYILK